MKYDNNTEEGCAVLAKALSAKLGYDVHVEKIANRVFVNVIEARYRAVAEVVEDDLLDSEDPIAVFLDQINKDITFPAVFVPRDACLRQPFLVGEDGKPLRGTLCIPTEKGPAPCSTFSSDKKPLEGHALADMARKINHAGTTFAQTSKVRTYQEPPSGGWQAWCDGAILQGNWKWDESKGMLVRA